MFWIVSGPTSTWWTTDTPSATTPPSAGSVWATTVACPTLKWFGLSRAVTAPLVLPVGSSVALASKRLSTTCGMPNPVTGPVHVMSNGPVG